MGTGSFGGGGGGGVRATSGAVRSFGGRLQSTLPPRDKAERELQAIFSRLPREYVLAYFKSPLVQSLYQALFRLNIELRQNHSWDRIEATYGVSPGPGCLKELVGVLLSDQHVAEPNEKVRQTATNCISDFLVKAVGNDTRLFLHGNATEVIRRIDGAVFDSTSAHFLTPLLTGMLRRERERLPEATELQLTSLCEGVANRIVARYTAEHQKRGEVRYRELLQSVADDPDLFSKGVRR